MKRPLEAGLIILLLSGGAARAQGRDRGIYPLALRARAGAGAGSCVGVGDALAEAAPGGEERAGVAAPAALARGLAAPGGEAEAAQGVLAALAAAFAPDRAFVLAEGAGGVRPICGKGQGAAVSISRTVLDRVRREGRGVLLDDAVADPELQRARSVIRHGLRSVMVAPIAAGAQVRGFVHVDRAGPGLFTGEDLALLAAMAAVIGLSERLFRSLHPGGAMATAARPPAPGAPGSDAAPRRAIPGARGWWGTRRRSARRSGCWRRRRGSTRRC